MNLNWPVYQDAVTLLPNELISALRDRGIDLKDIDWGISRRFENHDDFTAWFHVSVWEDDSNPIPDLLPLFVRLLMMAERAVGRPAEWVDHQLDSEFDAMNIHILGLIERMSPDARDDVRLIALLITHAAELAFGAIPPEALSGAPAKYAEMMQACLARLG